MAEFKKFFLFNLIGSLIISALVGVATILFGEFNEITGKVLLTLLMVILHSLFCLGFIWKNKNKDRELPFFSNVLFFLIVFSFITSILGIWQVLNGNLVWNLYQTYVVIGLSALHGSILSVALKKENYIDKIIYANFVFVSLVALMLFPIIYSRDAIVMLGEVYFRILGAVGIVDGTLSVLTMIFYKIHLHNAQNTPSAAVNVQQSASQQTVKTEQKKKI